MKKYLLFLFFAATGPDNHLAAQNLKLWYRQPAAVWTEALPVGNGRLGAMVFGRVGEELIQLNESSLWSGGPVRTHVNPEAPTFLPQIREALLKEGDYDKARKLDEKMQGLYSESYLPLGDLVIRQELPGSSPSAYYRDLDIHDAISTTKFTVDGVDYTRQVLASAPDQVIVIRLLSTKAGALNFSVSTKSLLHFTNQQTGPDEWLMKGKAPAHVDPSYYNTGRSPVVYEDDHSCGGMRWQLRIKALTKDGKTFSDSTGLHIGGATEAVLLLSAATSFNGFEKCPDKDGKDEDALARDWLDKAAAKTWQQLLDAHRTDYHGYFDRVSFVLKDTGASAVSLPADERLLAYSKGVADPGLETLYFQFGRYLLISSSRPGGQAANLQGIWNKELRAPWSSNY
ncbi:MAG TPA: glycoside hydrolase family 95 protein, partial [Puia sp.]|nr:glycoside hydrolase family 95 protein [Puia sp.]